MIKDRLTNAAAHAPLGPGVARALRYLAETDFAHVAPGKYEIDGERIFAMVQRYMPKQLADAVWESHRRYIDVQFVAAGLERMGHHSLHDPHRAPKIAKPYDAEKEVVFYEPGCDLLTFAAGDFAIFTPQDIHAPGLAPGSPDELAEVTKVVVKVRVDDRHPCGF